MLINLLPDFFAVLNSTDRVAAYHRYFETHRRLLEAYWHNYVLDPDGPHFRDVVQLAALADRSDLRAMLERTDVVSLARSTSEQCSALLEYDSDIDVVLMVGVGAANAGELVVDGRGVAFVCLEHFTSVANPETQGLGLEPELIPLWLAHVMGPGSNRRSPGSSLLKGTPRASSRCGFTAYARCCWSSKESASADRRLVGISSAMNPLSALGWCTSPDTRTK